MAKRKPKRYKKSDLISKIKSHLRKRYGVPEEIIDYIDFESIIKEGMTMNEAYEALMRAEPRLKPYLSKRKKIKDIETKIEEDLYKQAKLLDDVVREAEEGDEQAKSIILDLLKKAIVEGDENAIEIIKTAYDLTPGEFAKQLIDRGVITEDEFKKLLEEAKKVAPPPKVEKKEIEEYAKLVKEIYKELKEIDDFLRKITLEDLKKIGYRGVKGILDKYLSELKLKTEKLKQFKEVLPEKAEEIDKLLKKIEIEETRINKMFEGLKPFDIEQVIKDAISKLTDKMVEAFKEVFRKELSKEFAELRKEIRSLSGELEPQEWKYCCLCYYCLAEGRTHPRLATHYYKNIAVCDYHAMKLEEEWRREGLAPQWNPDDMGECTECGRLVEYFRCSGGFIYCLECASKLSDKLVFDDELTPVVEKAKRHVKRILHKYGVY